MDTEAVTFLGFFHIMTVADILYHTMRCQCLCFSLAEDGRQEEAERTMASSRADGRDR